MKITFDDFPRLAVEARRASKPYKPLIYILPDHLTDCVLSYHNLLYVHLGLSAFIQGYSLESDYEVDLEHDGEEDKNDQGMKS